MNERDDPLWNPAVRADAQLKYVQDCLARFGVGPRGIAEWRPALRPRADALASDANPDSRPPADEMDGCQSARVASQHGGRSRGSWRPRLLRMRLVAPAIAAMLLLLVAAHLHRLAWREGAAWSVTTAGEVTSTKLSPFAPGGTIRTSPQQSLRIAVARIGELTLSPDSELRLLETGPRKHRVDLENGHLHARIWAPPGYFGISDARSETIDLGCEFDIWKQSDGSGRVQVSSGWIVHRVATTEVLVPAGFEVHFDTQRASLPRRMDVPIELARALDRLEHELMLSAIDSAQVRAAADEVAALARDSDAFTLLAVLSSRPGLAAGSLYSRLAAALGADDDPAHRAAWRRGDKVAIDAWWTLLPQPPKRWWANWMDAF